jgi:hypothetical protein
MDFMNLSLCIPTCFPEGFEVDLNFLKATQVHKTRTRNNKRCRQNDDCMYKVYVQNVDELFASLKTKVSSKILMLSQKRKYNGFY